MLDRASREARSRDERRQVAFARRRANERTGQTAAWKALLEQWKSSDDACLRLAAGWGRATARDDGLRTADPAFGSPSLIPLQV